MNNTLTWVLLGLLVGLTSCAPAVPVQPIIPYSPANTTAQPPAIDDSHPYFPTQKKGNSGMEVLAEGTLVLDNGYLRMKSSDGYAPLIIWPYGFSLKNEADGIKVIDDHGKEFAQVGDTITVGGGEGDAAGFMDRKLPTGAKGPFWIVSQVISSAPPSMIN